MIRKKKKKKIAVKTFEKGRGSGGLAIAINNLIYKSTEIISQKEEYIILKTNICKETVIIGVVN